MAIGGVMCALYGSGHRMARVRVERKGRNTAFISGASWEKVVEDASGCVWMTVAGGLVSVQVRCETVPLQLYLGRPVSEGIVVMFHTIGVDFDDSVTGRVIAKWVADRP